MRVHFAHLIFVYARLSEKYFSNENLRYILECAHVSMHSQYYVCGVDIYVSCTHIYVCMYYNPFLMQMMRFVSVCFSLWMSALTLTLPKLRASPLSLLPCTMG